MNNVAINHTEENIFISTIQANGSRHGLTITEKYHALPKKLVRAGDVAELADAIHRAIFKYKARGGENHNAFSIEAYSENNKFEVLVSFSEDCTKYVIAHTNTSNVDVKQLFIHSNKQLLFRVAHLILSAEFVDFRE